MEDSKNSFQRRKVIKTIGSSLALGGLGVTGTVAAEKRDLSDIYQKAREIRRKTDSQERFVEYLEKNSVNVTRTKSHFQKPQKYSEDNSGPSTQKVDNADLTAELLLGGDYTHTIADYRVEIKGGYGTGEPKNDAVSISWVNSDYDLPEGGTFTDNANPDNVYVQQSGFNGALWSFNDEYACDWGCDLWFSVGTRLKRKTTDTPRKVQATYQSAWSDGASISGMSIDYNGTVTMNLSSGQDYVEQLNRDVEKESFETNL